MADNYQDAHYTDMMLLITGVCGIIISASGIIIMLKSKCNTFFCKW